MTDLPGPAAAAGPVVGIVLTGGRSSRMGTDKALLVVDGVPMVRRAVDVLLAGGAQTVRLAGGDPARLVQAVGSASVEVVADCWEGAGPLGGALSALGGSTAIVVSCDLPRLRASTVTHVVAALGEAHDADVAVPIVGGVRQVHLVAIRRRAFRVLQARFDAGERSLSRALLAVRVLDVATVDDDEFRDLDRPEDVAEYARRSRDRHGDHQHRYEEA